LFAIGILRSFSQREECQGAFIALLADLTHPDCAALGRRESTTFRAPHRNDKVVESPPLMQSMIHTHEVRPRKDKRRIEMISDVLPFSRLWNCARIVFARRMGTMMRPGGFLARRFT